MKLYSYWRSTTSYRVRIALALKGIEVETIPIDLVAGQQSESDYMAINPIKGVPSLETNEGHILTQSMAILDYLDSISPENALLPQHDPLLRARILAAAMVFATDVHPVNNLKVVKRVKSLSDDDTGLEWMRHWMNEGFTAYQALIDETGDFSFGNEPTLADICLVAQLYNAHRWGVDLAAFQRLTEIEQRCMALPAFKSAHPDAQPDASN